MDVVAGVNAGLHAIMVMVGVIAQPNGHV